MTRRLARSASWRSIAIRAALAIGVSFPLTWIAGSVLSLLAWPGAEMGNVVMWFVGGTGVALSLFSPSIFLPVASGLGVLLILLLTFSWTFRDRCRASLVTLIGSVAVFVPLAIAFNESVMRPFEEENAIENAAFQTRTRLGDALYRVERVEVLMDEPGLRVQPRVFGTIGGHYRMQLKVRVPMWNCDLAEKTWDVEFPRESASLETRFLWRDLDPKFRRCLFPKGESSNVGFGELDYTIECSVMADRTTSSLADSLLARDELMRVRTLGIRFVRRDFDI